MDMGTLIADLRYALRMMRSAPGFTAAAIGALALGIGANTAIFTVVNSVMLEPLPYPHPEQIVRLGRWYPGGHGWSNSIPKYMVWRGNDVFSAMTLYLQTSVDVTLGAGEKPPQVKRQEVSADYFRVYGGRPALGRTFAPDEDLPNGPRVAVLSYRFWRNHMEGRPDAIGRTILLNGQPYTVVGAMQQGFESDPRSDLWLPLQADPQSTNQGHYLAAAARLKPGEPIEQARAAMKVKGEQFRHAYPQWMDKNESVAVESMRDSLVEDVRLPLMILLGAVSFVLLIACANVANLLLARAAVRQKELAIRAAVGASRWRMVRQLLTESVLLAGVGALLGFAIGTWGVRLLLAMAPSNIPRLTDAEGALRQIPLLDWRVAGFTIGVALLTGIVFGIFPALHTSNPDLVSSLKEGGRSGSGMHNRTRSVLVVSEIALALVLFAGAALMIRTFAALRSTDPGFDARHALAMETSMAGGTYNTTALLAGFVRRVTMRLEALPGVEAAAATISLPESGTDVDLPFSIAGRVPPKSGYEGDEQWRSVSAHYFRALKAPILRGREFTDNDTQASPPVVLINAAMAKKYWKSQDALGQAITIGKGLGPQFDDRPREVLGIVGNIHETGLDQKDEPVMYIPEAQMPEGLTQLGNSVVPLGWAVRTAGDPLTLRAAVEQEVQAVDSQIPVSHVRTMEQVVSQSLASRNFNMLLLSIFAGIALLLAAIGIYGLMSYSVEQRMQEIGIRVALGAARPQVMKLIIIGGMKLALMGVAVGLLAAFGITRVLASLLFGVKAFDPATFGMVAAGIAAIALVATYVPARRAAAVEASQALRCG
jgi:putative ABC transport system permease protein